MTKFHNFYDPFNIPDDYISPKNKLLYLTWSRLSFFYPYFLSGSIGGDSPRILIVDLLWYYVKFLGLEWAHQLWLEVIVLMRFIINFSFSFGVSFLGIGVIVPLLCLLGIVFFLELLKPLYILD